MGVKVQTQYVSIGQQPIWTDDVLSKLRCKLSVPIYLNLNLTPILKRKKEIQGVS